MNTKTYRTRPVEVEAMLVTDENMEEVAEWCGGRVAETYDVGRVVLKKDRYDRILRAGTGYWVVVMPTLDTEVYNKETFAERFEESNR